MANSKPPGAVQPPENSQQTDLSDNTATRRALPSLEFIRAHDVSSSLELDGKCSHVVIPSVGLGSKAPELSRGHENLLRAEPSDRTAT
jgi:hypothetical protein